MVDRYKIAFFSMEIGINSDIPTYSGGLGILAGDMLRSSADLELPIIGVTLLHKNGYFKQRINENGEQYEEDQVWNPEDLLNRLDEKVKIRIGKEDVIVGCWSYDVKGISGTNNKILFLDTDLEENPEHLRRITNKLYQGDRLSQEMVLGIAGVKMLKKLGCNIKKYHMNEGHSSLLTIALCNGCSTKDLLEEIRSKCVFTTHTPVVAGHDKFNKNLVLEKAENYIPHNPAIKIFDGNELNMTHLGLRLSGYINGVARKHRNVAEKIFPGYDIDFITNGIHSSFWTAEPFCRLYNKYIPSWDEDPFILRGVMSIPLEDIWEAHMEAKKRLIEEVNEKTDVLLDEESFTVGFARRFVEYKRSDMILFDMEKLEKIAEEHGNIQIIFAGKAHPNDSQGKELLKKVYLKAKEFSSRKIKIVFLEDYNINTAKLLVSGCDVWLNNPRRPYEASGTSGMKAAINGVPHFSTLDGWWLEGHIENVTGWNIGLHQGNPRFDEDESPEDEAEDLYNKLGTVVLPMFYKKRKKWKEMMRICIAINGSFFNTHRVMQQYVMEAYFK